MPKHKHKKHHKHGHGHGQDQNPQPQQPPPGVMGQVGQLDDPKAIAEQIRLHPDHHEEIIAYFNDHKGHQFVAKIVDKLGAMGFFEKQKIKGEHELMKSRGGRLRTSEQAREILDAGPVKRADGIFRALRAGKSINTFHQIAQWLSGPTEEVMAAYQDRYGQQLALAIKEVFGTGSHETHTGEPKTQYLLDLVAHGQPSNHSKLLLALGFVTHSPPNKEEMIRISELMSPSEAQAASQDTQIWNELTRLAKFGGLFRDEARRTMKALSAGAAQALVDQDKQDDTTSNKDKREHSDDRNEAKLEHLLAIVETHNSTFKVDAKKLGPELEAWARLQSPEVRQYVTDPERRFVKQLHKFKSLNRQVVKYLVELVQFHQPLPEHLFDSGPVDDVDDARDEDEAREESDKVSHVHSHLERKRRTHSKEWGTLLVEMEGMNARQRQALLYLELPDAERQRLEGEDLTPLEREELHQQAIQAFDRKLKQVGMKAPKRQKVLSMFGDERGQGFFDKTSGYNQLRVRMNSVVFISDDAVFRMVLKCKGSDYLHIRENEKLLGQLEQRSGRRWPDIQKLLGIDNLSKDESHIEVAQVGERGGKQSSHDVEEQAELRPEHWSIVLKAALKDNSTHRAQMAATRAYFAAKRRAALPDQGLEGSVGQGQAPLSKLDVVQFMQEVKAGITGKALERLNEPKHGATLHALDNATYVDVQQGLDSTKYKDLKVMSGNLGSANEMAEFVEAFEGQELLEEWSNIRNYRDLRDKDVGNDPEAQKSKKLEMRNFILDIRPQKMQWLEANLNQKSLVPTVAKLRAKLVKAGEKDEEFKQRLHDDGMMFDEIGRERTNAMSLLDQQRQKNTGEQWNRLSGKSGARKEATHQVIGEFRSINKDLDTHEPDDEQHREQVGKDHREQLGEYKSELKDRTQQFDEMRAFAKTVITTIIGIILGAVATIATGGLATAFAPIVAALVATVGTIGVKHLVLKALDGDDYDGMSLAKDLSIGILMAFVSAGTGSLAGEIIHQVMEKTGGLFYLSTLEGLGNTLGEQGIKFGATVINDSVKTALTEAMNEDTSIPKGGVVLQKVVGWLGQFVVGTAAKLGDDYLQQNVTNTYVRVKDSRVNHFAPKPKAKYVGAGGSLYGTEITPQKMDLHEGGSWDGGEWREVIGAGNSGVVAGGGAGIGAIQGAIGEGMKDTPNSQSSLGPRAKPGTQRDEVGEWKHAARSRGTRCLRAMDKELPVIAGLGASLHAGRVADLVAEHMRIIKDTLRPDLETKLGELDDSEDAETAKEILALVDEINRLIAAAVSYLNAPNEAPQLQPGHAPAPPPKPGDQPGA